MKRKGQQIANRHTMAVLLWFYLIITSTYLRDTLSLTTELCGNQFDGLTLDGFTVSNNVESGCIEDSIYLYTEGTDWTESFYISCCSMSESSDESGSAITTKGLGTLYISNTNFEDNYSSTNGGVVYSNGERGKRTYMDIQYTSFKRNVATKSGGAIATRMGLTATMTSTILHENVAEDGDAFFAMYYYNEMTSTFRIYCNGATDGVVEYTTPSYSFIYIDESEIYSDCGVVETCCAEEDLDHGVCDELEVLGCTNTEACNFDSSATDHDESSCVYAEQYYNCDGVCLSDSDGDEVCDELEVLGCTNTEACNFDSSATENDESSCDYAEQYYDCDGVCLLDSEEDCVDASDEKNCSTSTSTSTSTFTSSSTTTSSSTSTTTSTSTSTSIKEESGGKNTKGGNCLEECYDYDCDYWLNYGYTCESLEEGLGGCNCEGCQCGSDYEETEGKDSKRDNCLEICYDYDCDYWLNYGYTCEVLEEGLGGCNCEGCQCGSDSCPSACFDYSCDELLELGYTCDFLEGGMIGCDCSGCDCVTDSCADTCYSYDCEYHQQFGYECSLLEILDCDCEGCDCEINSCPSTCYDNSCDDLLTIGYTCEFLEGGIMGCDCSGCTCTQACEDSCFDLNCDEWTDSDTDCEILEGMGCDCTACDCASKVTHKDTKDDDDDDDDGKDDDSDGDGIVIIINQ